MLKDKSLPHDDKAPDGASSQSRPDDLIGIKADTQIKNHMIWAAGAGLIPIPIVDVAAITAVQLKLLAQISSLYGVPFKKELGKSIVGALVGSTSSSAIATGTRSLIKAIPIVGHTAGACALSIYAAATTYAVGHVFVHHFRTGGTLLDFNPETVRARFGELYQKAVERLRGESRRYSGTTDDDGAKGA